MRNIANRAEFGRKVGFVEDPAPGEYHGPLEDIHQFADIPGPFVLPEPLQQLWREDAVRSFQVLADSMQVEIGKVLDVGQSLPQGWLAKGDHVDAVVEICPKCAMFHHLQEVLIGGENHPHIDLVSF